MPLAKNKLTDRQQAFVNEYLIDLNAAAAYLRAGYKCSENVARINASRLLSSANVQKEIKAALDKRTARVEITQDMVLRELARVAFADLRSVYRPDGSLVPISELSDDAAASVSGVESTELSDGAGYARKLKRWDKVRALELLGKHLGMYTDKVALSGDVSIPPLIQIAFVDASQKGGPDKADKADKKPLP